MKIHNNTEFTIEQIESLPLLGTTINNWRGRTIALYQHPTLPDYVISSGITFNCSMRVICVEPKTDWAIALEYAANGKVYVSN